MTPRPAPMRWLVALVLVAMAGCVACRRSDSQTPPTKAAPVGHRAADDCPGGVCTIPPRKAPK